MIIHKYIWGSGASPTLKIGDITAEIEYFEIRDPLDSGPENLHGAKVRLSYSK